MKSLHVCAVVAPSVGGGTCNEISALAVLEWTCRTGRSFRGASPSPMEWPRSWEPIRTCTSVVAVLRTPRHRDLPPTRLAPAVRRFFWRWAIFSVTSEHPFAEPVWGERPRPEPHSLAFCRAWPQQRGFAHALPCPGHRRIAATRRAGRWASASGRARPAPRTPQADGRRAPGELAGRRLDHERRAEKVQDLWPCGGYTHRLSPGEGQDLGPSRLDAHAGQ